MVDTSNAGLDMVLSHACFVELESAHQYAVRESRGSLLRYLSIMVVAVTEIVDQHGGNPYRYFDAWALAKNREFGGILSLLNTEACPIGGSEDLPEWSDRLSGVGH